MASDGSVERISINITASATQATRSLNSLTKSLKDLESATSAIKSLNNVSSALKNFSSATKSLNLGALNNFKVTKSSVSNLTSLTKAINSLNLSSAQNLNMIASGLTKLGNAKTITSAKIKRLQELVPVLKQLANESGLGAVAGQITAMASSLSGLATPATNVATAMSAMGSGLRQYNYASKAAGKTQVEQADSADMSFLAMMRQGRVISGLVTKVGLYINAIRGVKNSLSNYIDASNKYIENQNLFQAAMGSSTQAATEFGLKAQSLLGIDFNDWMRNQGVFMTLATGMGTTADKASIMSQQLTQLGYDIASFYNINVDEAMQKLQSGLAGELEPLRRIGWDLSTARMQLELNQKGIDANVNSMTQAEKVALRYEMIMSQVTLTHGDMARTILAPANSLRVFQAQLQIAARAIGNIFIPALSAILPVAIGVVKAVTWVAQAIARLFGINTNFEIDYSSLDTSGIATGYEDAAAGADDLASSTGKAAKSAKEYKNTVMSFDELHKLNEESETGSSGSGGSGGGAGGGGIGDIAGLPTYDFFDGLAADFGALTDEWARKITEFAKFAVPVIAGIGGALLAWRAIKILKDFGVLGKYLTKFGTTTPRIIAGMALAFAGLAIEIMGAFDAITNGLNFDNLYQMMLGGLAMVAGGFIAFGTVGAAIAGIVAGAILSIVSVFDMVNNGINGLNFAGLEIGAAGAGAAIGALVGGPLGALAGALIGLAAGGIITGVVWALSDCVREVDALADASDETKERFGDSLNTMRDMSASIAEHEFGKDIINDEDVAWVEEKSKEIHDTILNNIDSRRNEELNSIQLLDGLVSDERMEEIKTSINTFYDDLTTQENAANAELLDMHKRAAEEGRALTDDEVKREKEIYDQRYETLVQVSAETQEEIDGINEKMANNQERAALDTASKVIKAAREEKENSIKEAEEKYDGMIKEADRLKESGRITEDEYKAMTDSAEKNRDNTIKAAEDKFKGIKDQTEAGLGDASKKIDTETGNIKSGWDTFCDDLGKGWTDFWDGIGKNWDTFIEEWSTFFDNIGKGWTDFWDGVGKGWTDFWDGVFKGMGDGWTSFTTWLGETFQPITDLFQGLGDFIGKFMDDPIGTIQGVWRDFTTWFDSTFPGLSGLFKSLGDFIGRFMNDPIGTIKWVWGQIWGWFYDTVVKPVKDKFEWLKDKIIGFFGDAKQKVVDIWTGIVNTVKTPINAVINVINGIQFDVPNWVPAIGGRHFGFNIPRLATGGFVDTGQLFLAREAGPEMVGKIGRQTTVANNDQIVAGIQQGVMQAMLSVAPAFTGGNNKDNNRDTTIILQVGSEELARAVMRGNASLKSRGVVAGEMAFV